MEQISDSPIRNDYRPEFLDGKPTELQINKEFSYLFDHVLNGYRVPFQLRKYLFKILTLTKGGKTYAISDSVFAEQFGQVSKNYVVKLRKNLRLWFNSDDDNGIRNYSFVSIKENKFDTKTKTQKPTEYTFSLEFENLLGYLTKQIRQHKKYKENWIIALKETCAGEKTNRLSEFGFWDVRKKKRERSADSILGTYFVNFKRLSGRILEFTRMQGFAADETKELLLTLLPTFIEQAHQELILKESALKIKPSPNDFETFMRSAIDYLRTREETPETVFPKNFGGKNEIRGNVRQSVADERSGRRANELPALDTVLDNRTPLQDGEGTQPETDLDLQRKRFLERRKKRE